jgi:DNA-binding beta-propeller fold protein YncE
VKRSLVPLIVALLSCASFAQGELLVLNKSDATLSFVDPKDAQVLAVVGTGIGPHEVAVEPGGKRAVVANYGAARAGSSLTVVDLRKRMPVDTIDLGPHRRDYEKKFR